MLKVVIIQHFAESLTGSTTISSFGEKPGFKEKVGRLMDDFSWPKFHNAAAMEWLCFRLDAISSLIFAFSLVFLVTIPAGLIDPGNTSSRKIQLRSCDGEEFMVDEEATKLSQTISHLIEDGFAQDMIPIPNVTGSILAKVIEYCMKHVPSNMESKKQEELEKWDSEFLNVDQRMLFELTKAANYLNIRELLDLTCRKISSMLIGKSPEQIRQTFNLLNDLSAEKEEEIRRQCPWDLD